MKGKTIDAARLLAFMQPNLTRASRFLDPYAHPYFAVDMKDFWDFVLSETGTTPEDLNAFLDETFPEDEEVIDSSVAYLEKKR